MSKIKEKIEEITSTVKVKLFLTLSMTVLLVISVFVKTWKIGRIIYRSDHCRGRDITFNQSTRCSQQGMLQIHIF